jgi:hypothetical protein
MMVVVYAEGDNQEVASSASCYVCNSIDDSSCDDVYTPKDSHKKNCENGETFCRKTVQSGKWGSFCFFWMIYCLISYYIRPDALWIDLIIFWNLTILVRGEKSVIRQCAKELYKENFEGCYSTAGKATQNVCTCKADKGPCNSGILAKSSFGALVMSVVVSKFFF